MDCPRQGPALRQDPHAEAVVSRLAPGRHPHHSDDVAASGDPNGPDHHDHDDDHDHHDHDHHHTSASASAPASASAGEHRAADDQRRRD